MTIKDLISKYALTKDDCWELKRGGKTMWILTHEACEKIASVEKIKISDIHVLNSDRDFVRYLITAKKDDLSIVTTGEAMKENCQSNYYGCMAEKRGIDRAVLKLINAYEYGIRSEIEAEEFKQTPEKEIDKSVKQSDTKEQPNSVDIIHELQKSSLDEKIKIDLERQYFAKPENARGAFAEFIRSKIKGVK